ncbi:MAG TPA: c-type cytochrome, partial [Gemmata sp.]|nr:c-type cytochrome [Gemmata sp.]
LLAYVRLDEDPVEAIRVSMQILQNDKTQPSLKLEAIRLLQLSYGDLTAAGTSGTIWEGYTLRNPSKMPIPPDLKRILSSLFSSTKNADLKMEVSRTLTALGSGLNSSRLTWQLNVESFVEEDIHYLAVLARNDDEWLSRDTERIVYWLLNLEEKVARDWVARDTNWPLRLEEILEALGKANPDIAEKLLKSYEFGRPEHLMFVKPLGMPRADVARKFLNAAEINPDLAWTPGLVQLLDCLSIRDTRPVLLKLWERDSLHDAIIKVLANEPLAEDDSKFVKGLASFDPEVVRLSARSLENLSATSSVVEIAAAIKALRKSIPEDKSTRAAIVSLLHKRSGETFAPDPKPWTEWATRKYPETAKLLTTSDGFDPISWKKRQTVVPWDQGDATRGRQVFTKATCSSCHDSGRAMGPSLQGVSKRFSRDDLLTAILEPSKDVSPRYRPTRLTTIDDKVYIGMIVYEANDGVILQTGPDAVVRISGTNIASKRTIDVSLMPAGLLDKLDDLEIADLFAYLKAPEAVKQK